MHVKQALGLIVLFSLTTVRAELTNGLVAHYLLDGNANDTSGNGRSLTNNGAIADSDRFGNVGLAFKFNGSSSIMVETNNSDALVLHKSFTLSCWAKFPSFSATNYSLVRKDGDANLIIINQQCYVETFLNGNEYRAFAGSPPTGTWCMITATWDGTNFVQYLNGQQQISAQDNFARVVPSAAISLGGSLIYSDRLLGSLDNVRIYSRALSNSEAQQLYAYESGPRVNLIKAIKPSFDNLTIGTNYILQVSSDLNTWTNQGSEFTATNSSMVYPQYWDVDNWDKLFFRLQANP